MTVCMLAYTFYEADNRVRRYAEMLVRRGDHVDAIVLRRPGQPAFEVIRGVHVHRIQKRTVSEKGPFSYLGKLVLFFFRSALHLTMRHLRSAYDVIHVHSVPDFEVFATIIPRLLGARVILDIHDIVPELYASKFRVSERAFVFRFLLLIEKWSIAYSDHVIIANHLWFRKLVDRSVRSEKCTALINYPDLTLFRPSLRPIARDGEFVMCYPGTLNQHQGVDVAVQAMALLRDEVPRLKFLIIGDGPERENLKRMVDAYGLQDRVTLAGLVSLDEIARIMETIDLGVVPKRKDSFGNEAFSTKIMEFMAMGVPVIASRTRIDEYYFEKNEVEFFESGNPEDLAAKILNLIQHPAKRESLRLCGFEFVKQNNWEVKKGEYLDLLASLAPPDRQDVNSPRLSSMLHR